MQKNQITIFLESLIKEGEAIKKTEFPASGNWIGNAPRYVELEPYRTWQSKCRALVESMGETAKSWADTFSPSRTNGSGEFLGQLGELKGLQGAIDSGILVRYTEIIHAETFSNLSDQAEHLLENGYFLAAGAVLRAVLEEQLRDICSSKQVIISKVRATISDYISGLYKINIIDKVEMKMIEAIAAIGNDAAHNQPNLSADRVKIMLQDMPRTLQLLRSK